MNEEELMRIALPIMQGLLASGHYTTPDNDDTAVGPLKCDNGKDYDKQLLHCRHTSIAVEHAIDLAVELHAQIKLNSAGSE